ncbi:unnamed protein product [Rodentolepis nana]|uniref:Recep_L_domain domain-containing protein n=1 Tax=Rodentolepis nana TaxID=102285 RepID=A0A0R3T8K5_RODNA|nr:unnamed protein product [Rodentolepis nana]
MMPVRQFCEIKEDIATPNNVLTEPFRPCELNVDVLTEPFRPCELNVAIIQLNCKKSTGKDDQWLQVFTAGTILEINGSKSSLMLQNLLALETINVNYTGDHFSGNHRPLRQSIETINVNYSADQWLVCTVEAAKLIFQEITRQSMSTILQINGSSDVNYPADQWLQVFTESQGNVGAGVYSELFSSMPPSLH